MAVKEMLNVFAASVSALATALTEPFLLKRHSMAKNTLSRVAKMQSAASGMSPAGKAKDAAVKPIAKAPDVKPIAKIKEVVPEPVKVPEEEIAPPVAEAPKKPKKARFVREKKEKRPPAKPVSLPPRSRTAAGKMMSKNVIAAPKEETESGPGPRLK